MMRHRFINTILFLTSLTLTNCDRNKTATDLMITFSHNKSKLTTIVNSIQADKILDSLFYKTRAENGIPDIRSSYPNQYRLLKEVGITDASAHKSACPQIKIYTKEQEKAVEPWYKTHFKRKWYYFKTNWQSDHPVFLIYNECDTAKTRKGFYERDEYQNETWGLGDNWEMFRLIRYKDYKQ